MTNKPKYKNIIAALEKLHHSSHHETPCEKDIKTEFIHCITDERVFFDFENRKLPVLLSTNSNE
jgi:hypothetical protein